MQRIFFSWMFLFFIQMVVAQKPTKFITHKVVKGETLYSIAKQYHLKAQTITQYNEAIGKDLKIKIGQKIQIPQMPAAKEAAATVVTKEKVAVSEPVKKEVISTKPETPTAQKSRNKIHVVRKGDNIYAISKRYQISRTQLMDFNALTADSKLKIGQKLIVGKVEEEALYTKSVIPATEKLATDNEAPATPLVRKVTPYKEIKVEVIEPKKEVAVKEEVSAVVAPKVEVKKEEMEVVKTANINSEDYAAVFNNYAASGLKRKAYRGIGTFLPENSNGNINLALYNFAEIGSILKVTNLMSKKVVYLKVIGKVSATESQNEVIIKVSNEIAKQLSVNENKFLVEVSSFSNN
jgi:LysM repeat protein